MGKRREYSTHHSAPRRDAGRPTKPRPRVEDDASTHCESRYLQSLMQDMCKLVFVLQQGEQITGQLAWYDERCLKVTPSDGSPSLLIPKGSLKYLYELTEVDATN